MPHVTIEHSVNVSYDKVAPLLPAIFSVLVAELPTQLESCKGRVLRHEQFLVGDGHAHHAFLHVNIRVLPGRSPAVHQRVTELVMAALKEAFANQSSELRLQLTVDIGDLSAAYQKHLVAST